MLKIKKLIYGCCTRDPSRIEQEKTVQLPKSLKRIKAMAYVYIQKWVHRNEKSNSEIHKLVTVREKDTT